MKRISNNRQRLVLSRSKKPSTPQKPELSKLNGLRLSTLHSALAVRDSNASKPSNSSIFEKQSSGALLLRCRSISCVDKDRTQNKPIPSLIKFESSHQPLEKNKFVNQDVQLAAIQFSASLRQRGLFTNQANSYSISKEALHDLIIEFGEKIRQQFERNPAAHSDDTFSSKPGSLLQFAGRSAESFLIENQYSLSVQGVPPSLSFCGAVVNVQIEGESLEQQKCLQQAVDSHALRPEQQALSFLCSKLKYLQKEAESRESRIHQLSQDIDSLIAKKQQHQIALEEIATRIRGKEEALNEVERQVQDIEGFVHRQPNRILQQEAEGYKQREQELFDLAYMMDQSSIESVANYVEESILIPRQSFKLTLSNFASREPNAEGNICVSKQAIEAFCSSISLVYDSTVNKLKAIIDAKASKIRDFVGIMRRLASYTIGKREYLTEINKKMASASITADRHLKVLRKNIPSKIESFDELQELFDSMKSIYCEAEVFY